MPLLGAIADKRANESLHSLTSNAIPWAVALCLEVYTVQAQLVLVDDAINTTVTRAP